VSLSPGHAISQTRLSGHFGIDLENQSFKSSIKDPNYDFLISRSLSGHFISLTAAGPAYYENFATYSLSTRIDGSYYSVRGKSERKNKYFIPRLNSYSASMSLLPLKPYSLALSMSKAHKKTIRSEPSNRTETEILSPELAVIRRYQSDIKSYKGKFRTPLSRYFSLSAEFERSDRISTRGYDFNEDRNIWVSFTEIEGYPVSEIDTIEVKNLLVDDSTTLYIDYVLIDTIRPGEEIFVEVDSGYHNVDIVPFYYNSYSARLHIQRKMQWEIIFVQPAGVRDSKQDADTFLGALELVNTEKIDNNTNFTSTSSFDSELRLDNKLSNITNNFLYTFSRLGDIGFETSFNKNQSIIDTISSRINETFTHKSSINWSKRNNLSTSLAHTYTKLNSETNGEPFSNTIHNVANTISYPITRFNYTISAKNTIMSQSDDTGYKLRQYISKISNYYAFQIYRILIEPKNETKFQFNQQISPDNQSREIDNRFMLDGTAHRVPAAGRVIVKTEYQWRKRFRETGDEITKKYQVSLSAVRSFSKDYKLSLNSALRKETYGGSSPIPGDNPDQNSPAREDQKGFSYGASLESTPIADLAVAGSIFISKQNSSTVTSYGLTVIASVPKLNIPVKTMIIGQSKGLEGLPSQTQFVWKSETSYRFRKIVLVLKHKFMRENLLKEKYSYHEILGQISRRFSIL
jgi:hypothetical protein